MSAVTFNLVTEDANAGEIVVYLIEEGPWPADQRQGRLKKIQSRLYDTLDALIDGHLAERFPNSIGKAVRIQVDTYNDAPNDVHLIAESMNRLIHTQGEEYCESIGSSPYVSSIRLVTRNNLARGIYDSEAPPGE